MAGSRKPGPQCATDDGPTVEDGTLCRAPTPLPGPLGTAGDDPSWTPGSGGGQRTGAASLLSVEATEIFLVAIRRETGCAVGDVLKNRTPELASLLCTIRPALSLGSAPWGVTSLSSGRVVGGLGGILASLGLDFLPIPTPGGSGEIINALMIEGWRTDPAQRQTGMDPCALAPALGTLVRLILQGVVQYLLEAGASVSAPVAAARWRTGRVDRLRSSKLGDAFATWVAANWKDLLTNPRLQFQPEGGGVSSVTPVISQRRKQPSPAPPRVTADEAPTFSPDLNMAAQAATLVAAAVQGTPFCPM
jgi:hypothetical protein